LNASFILISIGLGLASSGLGLDVAGLVNITVQTSNLHHSALPDYLAVFRGEDREKEREETGGRVRVGG
jgi:hypothetical protein